MYYPVSISVAGMMLCPEVMIINFNWLIQMMGLIVKVIWEWEKEIIMKYMLSHKFAFGPSSGLWVGVEDTINRFFLTWVELVKQKFCPGDKLLK